MYRRKRGLYAAHGGEARAELHGELVGEVAPVVVADLRLEAVQDLGEHLLEVVLGVRPGGDRVAEEHEVGHHAAGVHLDHLADAAEGGVLLVVVADVAQRRAPAGRTLSFLTLIRSSFSYTLRSSAIALSEVRGSIPVYERSSDRHL